MTDPILAAVRDELAAALRRTQRAANIARLDQGVAVAPAEPEAPDARPTSAAGREAAQRAIVEWQRGVREPPGVGSDRIDLYIRGPEGLGWGSAEVGLHARPGIPYTRNGQFAWCGAFAAWCWSALRPEVRRAHLASTYRLLTWAQGDVRTTRLVPLEDIEPGDVLLMGYADGPREGSHIGIATDAAVADNVPTIEGNAHGAGNDGTRYEGVVRQVRAVARERYRVLWAVRPLSADIGA